MNSEAEILYNKGNSYLFGNNGVTVNYPLAYDYLRKAANMGHSGAMNHLGVMFENHYIKSKPPKDNLHEAFAWYMLSSNQEIQSNSTTYIGRYNVARMISEHPDIEGNPSKSMDLALKLMTLATMKLNESDIYYSRCNFTMGAILINYYHDYPNAWEAFAHTAAISEKYNYKLPEAWYNLGYMAETRICPEPTLNTDQSALTFYMEAAEMGYIRAMDAVGRMYAKHKKYRDAIYWTEMAANRGYQPAKTRLKGLKLMRFFG